MSENPTATEAPTEPDTSETPVSVYESKKVDELREEIATRNAARGEGDQISASGTKADLVAALEADDVAPGAKQVSVRLGDGDPVEVTKPSADYSQLVYGYGYKEV